MLLYWKCFSCFLFKANRKLDKDSSIENRFNQIYVQCGKNELFILLK